MSLQLFPKQEYWLETTHAQPEVVTLLSANIIEEKPFSVSLLWDGLINDNSRYFEGEIKGLFFSINHKHRSAQGFKIFPPEIKGDIEISQKGSTVHITSTVPVQNYGTIVFASLFILFFIVFRADLLTIFTIIPIAILVILIQRYFYLNRQKKDKEKLMEILTATEIDKPLHLEV